MTKAKNSTSTLAIPSETVKGEASPPIRKLAAELGWLFEVMDECESIESTAKAKRKMLPESTTVAYDLLALERDAEKLAEIAWRRHEFIESVIAHSEPTDAVDSLILLVLAISSIDGGEQWVRTTLDAETENERDALIKQFDDQTALESDMLHAAVRGLVRTLGVTPEKLGLKPYWTHDQRGAEFTMRLEKLQREAKQLDAAA